MKLLFQTLRKMELLPFVFYMDKEHNMVTIYIAGSTVSYVAMLFNVAVFIILCRKNLLSPASILMQGVACADFLTAFCCYGLEPFFRTKYVCSYSEKLTACHLTFPYCMISSHLSVASMTFHLVSMILTTCIGVQKVIAILFPIWTTYSLSNKKSIICCISCFLSCIIISLPRHFAFQFSFMMGNICVLEESGDYSILEYSAFHYLFIQTFFMTSCCIIMIICTVYIVYKLVKNTFHGRMTDRRRQEIRSILMVVIILIIFVLSEIPKAILFLYFCCNRLLGNISEQFNHYALMLVIRQETALPILFQELTTSTTMFYDNVDMFFVVTFIVESLKLFTVVVCISKFVTYVLMSRKLRAEIITLFHCRKTM